MADLGDIVLHILLLLTTWTGALALVGGRRRSRAMIQAARLSLGAVALLATLALLILAYAFVVSDFSFTYVHRYSDRVMPMFYRLTSVWGGQEGSLLLWVWMLTVLGAAAVHVNRVRLREMIPNIIVMLALIIDFLCIVLLFASNPFDTYLVQVPLEGRGLNPLLQDPYMVTHPPALYVGYVGMAIPFVFAMAAVIGGHRDDRWVRAARSWTLVSWYFLSLGLVLGMLWAYEELGWGGFWGWDPVENAGLIPWLTATALIHSLLVQTRRRMFRIWNVALALLTFELTIFGTFLTRSGFIESVHAFARSSIGWYFLGFMGLTLLVSASLIIWRWPVLRSHRGIENVFSREFFLVLTNWVFVFSAALVLLLTITPIISPLFGDKQTISPAAFTRWMLPLGLVLLALIGSGPLMRWRATPPAELLRGLGAALLGAALLTLALFLAGIRKPVPLGILALCGFVVSSVLVELTRSVRARRRRGADLPAALGGLLLQERRRYFAYVIHLGVALMYIGFAGGAYKVEQEVLLRQGQRVQVGDYTLRYDGLRLHSDAQKQMVTTTITVFSGNERLGRVQPARWVYFNHPDQPTSEVDVMRSLREDLFVVLGGYDMERRSASFRVVINPLVNWIWIGFLLLTLGSLIVMLPRPGGPRREQPGEVS